MTPRMSFDECSLFKSVLRCAKSYLEFGTGGSTVLAASIVGNAITSVDSSEEWIDKVRNACESDPEKIQPRFVYVDVGSTGEWGHPSDAASRPRWPDYHRSVWKRSESSDADVYMVDGRFRVACFMQILLHGRAGALIMFHDYNIRPEYHIVEEVAEAIAVADSLSVFRRRNDRNDTHVREILASYEYNPI